MTEPPTPLCCAASIDRVSAVRPAAGRGRPTYADFAAKAVLGTTLHSATVSPRQPAQRSCVRRYESVPTERRIPATRESGAIAARSRASGPRNCPKHCTLGPERLVPSEQSEKSASGACGASACQAPTTSAACCHGQLATNQETLETG